MKCIRCQKENDREICFECESVMFSEALSFAAKKHAGQIRRNGSPYIVHPLKVAQYIDKEGFSIRHQVVALLHDVLEDTDATEEELKRYCDYEMLEAVKLVTKTDGYIEQEYIDNILNNEMAKAVKNSDRINNLMDSLNSGDSAFQKRYIKDTIEYYEGNFSKELDDTLKSLMERLGVLREDCK